MHDYHVLENALDGHLPESQTWFGRLVPKTYKRWFYRFSLEGGYLDELLNRIFVRPFVAISLGAAFGVMSGRDALVGILPTVLRQPFLKSHDAGDENDDTADHQASDRWQEINQAGAAQDDST